MILFRHQTTFEVFLPIVIWTPSRNIIEIFWQAQMVDEEPLLARSIKSTLLYSKQLKSQCTPLTHAEWWRKLHLECDIISTHIFPQINTEFLVCTSEPWNKPPSKMNLYKLIVLLHQHTSITNWMNGKLLRFWCKNVLGGCKVIAL